MRYRTKPVEVEAMQWVAGMNDSYVQNVFDWLRGHNVPHRPAAYGALIVAGWAVADGDWIVITGNDVEPVDSGVFALTYERRDG